MSERLITPEGTVSFPHFFTPRAPAPGQDPRYSGVLVFTPEDQDTPDFKAMRAAFAQAAQEKWGDNMPRGLRNPVRQCSEKSHFDSFPEGSVFVNFWSKEQPAIVNGALNSVTNPADVYSGQRARYSYRPFAYDTSGNRGVSVYLNNVQLINMSAPRIDGRVAADKEFSKVEGADTGASPAESLDGNADDSDPFA